MCFLVGKLPTELWLLVAAAMGVDATMTDWLAVEQVCRASRSRVDASLQAWADGVSVGTEFCFVRADSPEAKCIGRHAAGMCVRGRIAL
jgi:hypothetical protein